MLTDKQQAVLDVIRGHASQHGYPPTVREIGEVLGLASSSTVHSHIAALERAGYVERDPSKPRALRLADRLDPSMPGGDPDTEQFVALPLVGQVAAGAPLLAEESHEAVIPVPRRLVRSGTSFLLRIQGDSMIKAGILDGDWVVVRRQPDALDGEIVVALIEDEATCKRLVRSGGRIELHPENDALEPIIPDDLSLLGVVTGVMRAM